jgi:hypothetical protein
MTQRTPTYGSQDRYHGPNAPLALYDGIGPGEVEPQTNIYR